MRIRWTIRIFDWKKSLYRKSVTAADFIERIAYLHRIYLYRGKVKLLFTEKYCRQYFYFTPVHFACYFLSWPLVIKKSITSKLINF